MRELSLILTLFDERVVSTRFCMQLQINLLCSMQEFFLLDFNISVCSCRYLDISWFVRVIPTIFLFAVDDVLILLSERVVSTRFPLFRDMQQLSLLDFRSKLQIYLFCSMQELSLLDFRSKLQIYLFCSMQVLSVLDFCLQMLRYTYFI